MKQNTKNFSIGDPVKVKNNKYNSYGEIVEIDPHLNECKVNCINATFYWFKFSEITAMQSTLIEIECENCESEGYNEIGPDCFQPASNCCGGCFERIECENCEGSGTIEKCISEIIEEIDIFAQN